MRVTPSKLCAIVLLAGIAAPARSQTRFDVISIKPSPPGATAQDSRVSMRGDTFEMTAATVGDVLDMLN